MRLRGDQLERRRLIIVVAGPTGDKGGTHASSMAGHVAQLRRLARGMRRGMDTGRSRLAAGWVDIILCLLGGLEIENDDAGGGVASRCLGRLVVWRQLAAYR